MPPRPWKFLKNKTNREILSWLGGGATVVAAGVWAVVVFFHQGKGGGDTPAPQVIQSGTGIASGRDTHINGPLTINQGLDEKKNAEQITQAQKPLDDKLEKLLAVTAREKGVEIPPLRAILMKLGEAGVHDEDIARRLDEKADELVKVREENARLRRGSVELAAFAEQVQALIDKGDLQSAGVVSAAARAAMHGQSPGYEADFIAQEARIAHLQLAYREAAVKYAEAARLVASLDHRKQWEFMVDGADELFLQGEQFGDNAALIESFGVFRDALSLAPREVQPIDWAKTQNDFANALTSLGQRESGTARLEEAVTARREALKEFTRERTPAEWALAQLNLGVTLEALALREGNAARNGEAIAAFREALKEITRDKSPSDWAALQNNLGSALVKFSAGTNGTARLDEAATAFRGALKEVTRERAPVLWGMLHNNLANALTDLAKRESGNDRLDEAIGNYRDALGELTRARTPPLWATAQHNLGFALETLAQRTGDSATFEQAAAAFREALKVRTRETAPPDWAQTQTHLGNVLQALGLRESDNALLAQAVAAYDEALKETSRERTPFDWALNTASQGVARIILAVKTSDRKMAQVALDQIETAAAAVRDSGDAANAANIDRQAAIARTMIEKMNAP